MNVYFYFQFRILVVNLLFFYFSLCTLSSFTPDTRRITTAGFKFGETAGGFGYFFFLLLSFYSFESSPIFLLVLLGRQRNAHVRLQVLQEQVHVKGQEHQELGGICLQKARAHSAPDTKVPEVSSLPSLLFPCCADLTHHVACCSGNTRMCKSLTFPRRKSSLCARSRRRRSA